MCVEHQEVGVPQIHQSSQVSRKRRPAEGSEMFMFTTVTEVKATRLILTCLILQRPCDIAVCPSVRETRPLSWDGQDSQVNARAL